MFLRSPSRFKNNKGEENGVLLYGNVLWGETNEATLTFLLPLGQNDQRWPQS